MYFKHVASLETVLQNIMGIMIPNYHTCMFHHNKNILIFQTIWLVVILIIMSQGLRSFLFWGCMAGGSYHLVVKNMPYSSTLNVDNFEKWEGLSL